MPSIHLARAAASLAPTLGGRLKFALSALKMRFQFLPFVGAVGCEAVVFCRVLAHIEEQQHVVIRKHAFDIAIVGPDHDFPVLGAYRGDAIVVEEIQGLVW